MHTSEVSQLLDQIRELKQRVEELEKIVGVPAARVECESRPPAAPSRTVSEVPGLIPAVGRALLIMGGAFLLRAASESGTVPATVGVVVTVLYAALWLGALSRSTVQNHVLTGISGVTTALILYPMLWETTVRFHVLAPTATACVIAFFPAAALLVAWRSNLSEIVTITSLCSLASAVALIIATHDVIPFTLAILAIAAATEITACMDHWLPIRAFVALVADLAVALAFYLILLPAGLPEGYARFTHGQAMMLTVLLLVVSMCGTVFRTIVRKLDITNFEVLQLALVLLITLGGAHRVQEKLGVSIAPVGLIALGGGMVCYLVAFAYLERRSEHRNFYVYASLALVLVAAGAVFVLQGLILTTLSAAAACIATYAGIHYNRNTVRWHGVVFLLFAGFSVSLISQSLGRLMDSSTAPITLAEWAVWAGAAVSYGLGWVLDRKPESTWQDLAAPLLCAALVLLSTAGLVAGLVRPLPYSLTITTVVIAVFALQLARSGTVRKELSWLLYPWMLLAGYKLLLVDFQKGGTAGFALSLAVFGGTMLLLPRLTRRV
jgi:hypothetical protein